MRIILAISSAFAGLLVIALVARARARARGVAGESAAKAAVDTPRTTLGGRRFDLMTDGSIRWDAYVIGALRRAELIPLPTLTRGETRGEYAARLLVELIAGGELATLIGGLLCPAGQAWTPDVATQTVAHIQDLTHPDDKRKIHNLAISILLDFFEHGIASSLISLDSSHATETETANEGDPATSGSAGDTASGHFWSQFSRTGTPIDPNALLPGAYGTRSEPTGSGHEGSRSSSTDTK